MKIVILQYTAFAYPSYDGVCYNERNGTIKVY